MKSGNAAKYCKQCVRPRQEILGSFLTKECFTCHAKFDSSSNHAQYCPDCRAERHRETNRLQSIKVRKEKPRVVRGYKIKRVYGITPDDYDRMFEDQKGVCSICFGPETTKRGYLCVDHDHTTGKVRSLLCSRCNSAIGMLKEKASVAYSAAKYLEKYVGDK